MTIFYINSIQNVDGKEYIDKYDLSKFIDGNSDIPEEIKTKLTKTVNGEK